MRRKDYIRTRTKLDQPDALAALQLVANFLIEHDAAGQQSGNLLEDHNAGVAAQRDDVLLVLIGRNRAHGIAELAFLVAHLFNYAAYRRAVHVNVEYVQKDADARVRLSIDLANGDIGDLAVGGRDYRALDSGNATLRIAKNHRKNAASSNGMPAERQAASAKPTSAATRMNASP